MTLLPCCAFTSPWPWRTLPSIIVGLTPTPVPFMTNRTPTWTDEPMITQEGFSFRMATVYFGM